MRSFKRRHESILSLRRSQSGCPDKRMPQAVMWVLPGRVRDRDERVTLRRRRGDFRDAFSDEVSFRWVINKELYFQIVENREEI